MTGDKPSVIDEKWLPEWVEFGFAELTVYLAKRASFDAFYAAREDERAGIETTRPAE